MAEVKGGIEVNSATPDLRTPDSGLRALEGIKVLDLSRLLPGPFASMILADFGADVIKLEEPQVGDPARWAAESGGESPLFAAVNRNKRSLTLNLKEPRGLEVFHRLVAQVDVVLESFRPGVTERLGVDYKRASEVNPTIIYCSLTGYGQDGPLAGRSGHDINYIALAGALGLTVDDKGKPTIPGLQVADMAGALMAVIAIQAALIARARTGRGQYIDLSMTDTVLSLMPVFAAGYFAGRPESPDKRYELTGARPYYGVYRTKEGRYMALGALEPKFWENFCTAVNRPDLKRRQFDEGKKREEVFNSLRRMFGSKTQAEWCEVFAGHDACCEPVLSFGEAVTHPNTAARQMVGREGDGGQRLNNPAKFSASPTGPYRPAPALGEHTGEILREFGFSEQESQQLARRGVTHAGGSGVMGFVQRIIRSVIGR